MKLSDIAILLNGTISGETATEITGVAGLSEAVAGDITYLLSTKLLAQAKASPVAAVLVKEFIADLEKPQIKVENPHMAFAKLLGHFYVKPHVCIGISDKATVSATAVIGEKVSVYSGAYISGGVKIGSGSIIYPGVFIGEDSVIGEGCIIHPNVTIREGVQIGRGVIIQPGAVIGADGFGYIFDGRQHVKIPQVGGVILEDGVEIGANTTVDRATTGNTVIGMGTKIDNLVQIGHNCKIGRGVILVSQVGVAGSCTLGDGVVAGGQAGIPDHVNIEAGTMIGAQAGVLGDLKKGVYLGAPAVPHKEFFRCQLIFSQLPELKKKIEAMDNKLNALAPAQE